MGDPSSLRIMHIASGDLWAGAEVQLYNLARAQHDHTPCRVSIILLNPGRLERMLRKAGMAVVVINETQLNGLQILLRIKRVLREQRPDLVHTHRLKENILGSLAAFLAGRVPSLRTVHGAREHRHAWLQLHKTALWYLDWLCGRFLQRRIVAVSTELAGKLARQFPADRIAVIENGIDVAAVRSQLPGTAAAAGGKDGGFRIGLAGRLVPVKRADLFIRAAGQILEQHPELDAHFHLYGSGPLRERLEQLGLEIGVGDRIHFEGHCDDMPARLGQLDALLITSDHEGLPMVLLEAMALQTPVIAHAVGGIPQVLDHGACGILVGDHSSAGYARAVYDLLTDPARRDSLTRNALQRVSKHYSIINSAAAYCAEYHAIRAH